jgi:intracellular septation protein
MWVAFFVVAGALNLYVAYNFSESTWVNFKLFGMLGLTVVFALAQGVWLAKKSEQLAASPTPQAE